jgi:hypothetical protein
VTSVVNLVAELARGVRNARAGKARQQA